MARRVLCLPACSGSHTASLPANPGAQDTADAFVETGMKAAGYSYVNVDDCWMAMERTADGKLTHDPVRFPSGMKALAQYVHSRGLSFGLYSARCGHTCQGRPGSEDHEWTDAQTFAGWDIDYLKYDNCGSCKYGYGNTPAKIMQVDLCKGCQPQLLRETQHFLGFQEDSLRL